MTNGFSIKERRPDKSEQTGVAQPLFLSFESEKKLRNHLLIRPVDPGDYQVKPKQLEQFDQLNPAMFTLKNIDGEESQLTVNFQVPLDLHDIESDTDTGKPLIFPAYVTVKTDDQVFTSRTPLMVAVLHGIRERHNGEWEHITIGSGGQLYRSQDVLAKINQALEKQALP